METTNQQNYNFWLAAVLVLVLIARVVSLWFNNAELFFDEAQYWYWSTQPDFGYFSKPPLIAWIINATTSLCGSQSEFCVRLAAPIMHVGTAFFIYLSAKHLFDSRTGFWSAVTWLLLPAVSLSSTLISTDVPLLFFWSLALYFYLRLRDELSMDWAILLGLAIGFGLNSKYAMIYFIGCAILHAILSPQEMAPARKSGFWIAVVIAGLMLVPNLVWNINHDFVTASHTGDNIGWSGFDPNWTGLAEFFGSQFGVFGPILFALFLIVVFQSFRGGVTLEYRLLLSFSVPVLVLILIQAVMSKAYANWAAPTYVAATILVTDTLMNRLPWHLMRTNLTIHGVVALVIAVAVCFAAPGQLALPNGDQPFKRMHGSTQIAAEAEKLLDEYDYNGLVTTDRKLSALMQYKLRHREESILAWRHGDIAHDHFQLDVPFQESLRDPVLVMSRQDNMTKFSEGFAEATDLGARLIRAGEIEKVYFFRLEKHEEFQ